MLSDETLQLTNSDFLKNQTKYYSDLLVSQELSDITLACDGYEVGAHKTILSASSQFFREVIRKSKHVNPYIYLKGVSKESLDSLLKFIYVGEATARNEDLENLVDAGNELKIIGIMKEPEIARNKVLETEVMKKTINGDSSCEETEPDIQIADFLKIETGGIQGIGDENMVTEADDINEDLEKEIAKRMTSKTDEHGIKQHVCTICFKEMRLKQKMKLHIEIHLEGFSHKCKFCRVIKKTRRALHCHLRQYHGSGTEGNDQENIGFDEEVESEVGNNEVDDEIDEFEKEIQKRMAVTFDDHGLKLCVCTVCKKELKSKQKMKYHIESHLEGFSHKCKLCEAVKSTKRALDFHMWSNHTKTDRVTENKNSDDAKTVKCEDSEKLEEEIAKIMKTTVGVDNTKWFVCNECGKELKLKQQMKKHIETHLEGFCYTCKVCGTEKKTKAALYYHMWHHHNNQQYKPKEESIINEA